MRRRPCAGEGESDVDLYIKRNGARRALGVGSFITGFISGYGHNMDNLSHGISQGEKARTAGGVTVS